MELQTFLDTHSGPSVLWYLKRLSANDTTANGSHQAGHYVPLALLFELFPAFRGQINDNQHALFKLVVDSHECSTEARAIWYNNKYRGGTRDEARLTRLGGQSSPLQDPESTGSLVLFAFRFGEGSPGLDCRVWACRDVAEEDYLEGAVGPVEPGQWISIYPHSLHTKAQASYQQKNNTCWLDRSDMEESWFKKFPTGQTFIDIAVDRVVKAQLTPDERLLKRRACEFEAFRSVEEAVELHHVLEGFQNIDGFLKKAQSILQRRKSRSGRSLELHVKKIFEEEGLLEGESFSWQAVTEMNKKPDFIFPTITRYKDGKFSASRLRMLAVKTTCKDRWRQVINEAERIDVKHLLTLQEGISLNQHAEMKSEGVVLVVPNAVKLKYPKGIRSELMSVGDFIDEAKKVCLP